jgi:maleate cis-trans isomerase
VAAINDLAVAFLNENGIEAVARSEVAVALDNDGQGALTPEQVFQLGLQADHPQAETIVLSCTDMRSVEVIARLEDALGKPVITSNQAMCFQAVHILGLDPPRGPFGVLMQRAGS